MKIITNTGKFLVCGLGAKLFPANYKYKTAEKYRVVEVLKLISCKTA